jgi:hypothetical protein
MDEVNVDSIILDLLKGLDAKIDRISQDIAAINLKNVEHGHKIGVLEDKYDLLTEKIHDTNEKIKTIGEEAAKKRDVDMLFEKVRTIESAPTERLKGRVGLLKKAIWAGVATLITGAVASLGLLFWTVINNINAIIDIVQNLAIIPQ